jgi:hypothetical protein
VADQLEVSVKQNASIFVWLFENCSHVVV